MATESDPTTTRITVVLDKPSDWHNWLFIRQDTAQRNGLWQYVNPDIAADQLPELTEPVEPQLADYKEGAQHLGNLTAAERDSYKWDYERYEKRYAVWSKKNKALADLNSEISKTVAKRHLYLLWSKPTPYERLATLKQHLAPTDATRRRELIGRYAALQTPARGKKVGDWLSSWVDVTNQCKELELPETTGTRAQEDFLVACKAIDPEWATACLREVYKKEASLEEAQSVETYAAEFTTYLRRTKPITTGLSAMVSELEVAMPTDTSNTSSSPSDGISQRKMTRCACGLRHRWVDCWVINLDHPRRPSSYVPKPSLVEKVKAARKKDPRLNESIDRALARWREKNGVTVSVSLDDGKPPSKPTSIAAAHLAHTDEAEHTNAVYTDAVFDDDQQPQRSLQVLAEGATDELADRWILDPGSNTHVINSEAWGGWVRERDAAANETVGAGVGRIRITAWGRVTVMANTPRGVEGLVLTHVALVEGFITSVIGLARCRAIGVHFDSGRDRLYRISPQTIVADLEYNGGHWLVDADPTKRPLRSQLRSLSVSHRPSMTAKIDQQISAEAAHLIWGHPGSKAIDKLETNVVGVQVVGQQSAETCSVCMEAKLTRQIARRQQDDHAQRPFYRVALDLIQLLPTGEACLNDDRYAGHLVDQASKWHEVETFSNRSRSILSRWLIRSIRRIQRVFDRDITALRMDNEPGFGTFAEDTCSDLGIRYEPSAEYTPEQNGLAERAGKQLVVRARAMRLHANLPESLSHELVRTAAYILNRTPTEALNWKTPYEIVWGRKPSVAHMHPVGCRAYVLNNQLRRGDKLRSRALIGHLVGYDSTNIWRIWLPTKDEVIRTRDVVFDPQRFYEGPDGYTTESVIEEVVELLALAEPTPEDDIDTEELLTTRQNRIAQPATNQQPDLGGEEIRDVIRVNRPESSEQQRKQQRQLPTPEPSIQTVDGEYRAEDTEDARDLAETGTTIARTESHTELSATQIPDYVPDRYTNNAPKRRNLDPTDQSNIIENKRPRKQRILAVNLPSAWQAPDTDDYLRAFSVAISRHDPAARLHHSQLPPEPRSMRDLDTHLLGHHFRRAAELEYRQIWSKGCFAKTTESSEPPDGEVLPLAWVFTYKLDEDGFLIKYKARLVVRGDQQQDFDDTYAATLAARTLRAVLALANQFDLELEQYDAPNAFLNAKLDRKSYVYTPDGFQHRDGKLLRVLRALYGLKDAPQLWFKELSQTLRSLGLTQVPGFPCLYINRWLILFVYVDDIVMAFHRSNRHLHREIERSLESCYDLKHLGPLSWFLRIRVIRDQRARKLWIIQDAYIDKVARQYGIKLTGRSCDMPMTENCLERSLEEPNAARKKLYQKLVGHLGYLTCYTRPDCSRAHVILASHLTNPGESHLRAAQRVWRYILSTKYLALQAEACDEGAQEYIADVGDRDPVFFGASDAAFADEPDTRRSSQGYVFRLYGMTIDWKSTIQRSVTKSTTEAELLALSLAGSQMEEWARFFRGVAYKTDTTPTLWCDNQQTVRIATQQDDKLITKLKHVDVHQSWVRQEVQAGRLNIKWVDTNTMPADGMTKVLGRQRHAEFLRQLHLVDISARLDQMKKK